MSRQSFQGRYLLNVGNLFRVYILQYCTQYIEILISLYSVLVEYLNQQWKNVKENYKRCLDKRNRMTRSGAANHTLPTCRYYEQLHFLNDKVSSQETTSNIVLPNDQTVVSPQLSLSPPESLHSPTLSNDLPSSELRSPEPEQRKRQPRQSDDDVGIEKNVRPKRKKKF